MIDEHAVLLDLFASLARRSLEHFQAKWIPVRRPKMRPLQDESSEFRFCQIGIRSMSEFGQIGIRSMSGGGVSIAHRAQARCSIRQTTDLQFPLSW
jgi:hypothetical protein